MLMARILMKMRLEGQKQEQADRLVPEPRAA